MLLLTFSPPDLQIRFLLTIMRRVLRMKGSLMLSNLAVKTAQGPSRRPNESNSANGDDSVDSSIGSEVDQTSDRESHENPSHVKTVFDTGAFTTGA